jgi:hypothetical protein
VSAALLSVAMAATAAAQSPRVIYAEPGISLVSKLRPDDRVVAVPGGLIEPGVDVSGLTLPTYIGLVVHGSAAGVLLDVTSATSRLSDDESWVVTDISGTVKRVLYTSEGHIDVGQPLSLTYDRGGEMKIGGVTMKVGIVPNVRAGRSYLAFLNIAADGRWFPWVVLFEMTKAQRFVDPARPVVPVPDDDFPELVLNNARVDLVLKMIQEELRRR